MYVYNINRDSSISVYFPEFAKRAPVDRNVCIITANANTQISSLNVAATAQSAPTTAATSNRDGMHMRKNTRKQFLERASHSKFH